MLKNKTILITGGTIFGSAFVPLTIKFKPKLIIYSRDESSNGT